MIDTTSHHLMAEYWDCSAATLNDAAAIEEMMRDAARAAGATIVTTVFHEFAPQGVTGVVVVEESHLSIHTWPEAGYAAVDFFTCGAADPRLAHDVLAHAFGAKRWQLALVERGRPRADDNLKIVVTSGDATAT